MADATKKGRGGPRRRPTRFRVYAGQTVIEVTAMTIEKTGSDRVEVNGNVSIRMPESITGITQETTLQQ